MLSEKQSGYARLLLSVTTRAFVLQKACLFSCNDFYRYTQDGGILSEKQRSFYEQNGYLVIKELVTPADLQAYKDRFQGICCRDVKVRGLTIMKDVAIAKSEFQANEKAVTKIQHFQNDEVLSQYFQSPAIIPYVTSIIGEDIAAMHTMLINKPPDPGEYDK